MPIIVTRIKPCKNCIGRSGGTFGKCDNYFAPWGQSIGRNAQKDTVQLITCPKFLLVKGDHGFLIPLIGAAAAMAVISVRFIVILRYQ